MKRSKPLYLAVALSGVALTACNSGTVAPTSAPYTINLTASASPISLNPSSFSLTTNGTLEPSYPSNVAISYDTTQQALIVEFNNTNDQYVSQNNYTQDNSSMWNQEVFEMFISAGAETPTKYVEIEINPKNALFSAWITNPNGKGTENTANFFDGRTSGIQTNVTQLATSWSGKIVFPLTILGSLASNYRVNFFRVVSLNSENPANPWACTTTSCAYLAWSPTFSGAAPAFHIPQYFGQINLLH